MKKLFVMMISIAMISAFAACGNQKDTAEETTEETVEEMHDVLAETTYAMTYNEYENENGELEPLDIDEEYAESFTFNNDGTYVFKYWEQDADWESPDLTDEEIENAELIEKEENGTYTVSGDSVMMSLYDYSNSPGLSDDEIKALTPTVTITGNDIVVERFHNECTAEDGSTSVFYGSRITYTKAE